MVLLQRRMRRHRRRHPWPSRANAIDSNDTLSGPGWKRHGKGRCLSTHLPMLSASQGSQGRDGLDTVQLTLPAFPLQVEVRPTKVAGIGRTNGRRRHVPRPNAACSLESTTIADCPGCDRRRSATHDGPAGTRGASGHGAARLQWFPSLRQTSRMSS